MNKTAHTPGPWEIKDTGEESLIHSKDFLIAVVRDFGGQTLSGSVANAGLIAAAPELLEALEMMLDRTANPITDHAFYTLGDARAKAERAISKAKA